MAAALRLFLEGNQETKVDLFGQGGQNAFAQLQNDFAGRLTYHGTQQQEVVAETLSRARAIVFSSRWEGCPHAAIEMLALGGTLIGTKMPSLQSWIEEGTYGRVAAPSRKLWPKRSKQK